MVTMRSIIIIIFSLSTFNSLSALFFFFLFFFTAAVALWVDERRKELMFIL